MCGFQRLASRNRNAACRFRRFVPAARIGARSHHARSCSAFSNDSRVRKSPIPRQTSRRRRRKARRLNSPLKRRAAHRRDGRRRPVSVDTQPAAQRPRTSPSLEGARARNRRNRPAARAGRRRQALVADPPENRPVENEFEPDRHFRRHEDRRGSVRRTRNRAADVGRGRRSHRIPARIACARKCAPNASPIRSR